MSLQDWAAFCKKKGFFYQSGEIYGGLSGFYDYGHLGTSLKQNFENLWRKYFLSLDDNFHEIETATIMPASVFKASGHLEKFADPVVNCSKCGFKERADHVVEKALNKRVEELTPAQLTDEIKKNNLLCPNCKSGLGPVRLSNMMFPLVLGTIRNELSSETSASIKRSEETQNNLAYLRPETAQSPYVNFKLQYELLRNKLPLGIALVGRAYRNEISPRNLILRQREFTQAELQIFFNPGKIDEHKQFNSVANYKLRALLLIDRKHNEIIERTAQELLDYGLPKFYVYHLVKIQQFYLDVLHILPEKFRIYELNDKEKAFYNKYHFDLEIDLNELGWTEVGGLHYRTDHDLQGHQKISKQSMEIFDEETGTRLIPHVLELSFGVDRNIYALLDLNYETDQKRGNVVLHLPRNISPIFCAVFPLVKNKPELLAQAEEVYELLRKEFSSKFDSSGSVGRRYARADEIGINFCITVDFESLEDQSVTIRDRDTTKQIRVKIENLKSMLVLAKENKFLIEELGKLVR